MRLLILTLFVAIMPQMAAANFLWATEAFWRKAHRDFVTTERAEHPPFITKLIDIDPKEGSDPEITKYRNTLVVIGDRIMAYTVERIDGEHMEPEDISYCLSGCSDLEAEWNKPVKGEITMSWMRSDNKVLVEYDHSQRMAVVYDFGYYMIDKTFREASNMKENGLGDAWMKRQTKLLEDKE